MLLALARAHSNAEISDELFIGAATVKSHVSNILTKLGQRSSSPWPVALLADNTDAVGC